MSEAKVSSIIVEKGRKDITHHEGGGTSMGKDGVALFRLLTIKSGLEMEMIGMRLTRNAPPCFKIITAEFGIKVKRSPAGKRAAYEEFCAMHGLDPRPPRPMLPKI